MKETKKINSYKDLIVWQKGMDLAVMVYKVTANFPKNELYSLTSQMRRAATSIVSNIAEGKGRDSKPEYLHFLAISEGSLCELETQILLSVRLNYLGETDSKTLLELCDEIGRMLTTLRSKLKVV